jgi:hypothetical protein
MEVGNLELPKSPAVHQFGIQSYIVTSPQEETDRTHTYVLPLVGERQILVSSQIEFPRTWSRSFRFRRGIYKSR